MGGKVGKIVAPIARVGADIATFGTNELVGNPLGNFGSRLVGDRNGLGAGSVYGGKIFGGTSGLLGTDMLGNGPSNPYISGPFSLDRGQLEADQAAIMGLADQQFSDTNTFNTTDQTNRAQARQALSEALTKQGQATFQQGLPATEETLNAQHLLNGSGLGQEIARQQGNLATNIANAVGVQGANDINRASDIGLGALHAKQGLNQSALSRGFSLEDFINQANVAKTIGAQAAPQVGGGKGETGTLLSGIGATAPLVGAVKGFGKGGPGGAAAGGLTGMV